MNIFWEKIIRPIFDQMAIKNIVEIGAEYGHNTLCILEYCKNIDRKLISIDPQPQFDYQKLEQEYSGLFSMMVTLSLQALQQIDDYDAVLIDGDHNWYTVYHELKTIEANSLKKNKFPIVFFHDTAPPFARRDLYYFPDTIPPEYRHPFTSYVPGAIAIHEYGPRNGVLTAIEDFLKETVLDLNFYNTDRHHGLGILIPKDSPHNNFISNIIHVPF